MADDDIKQDADKQRGKEPLDNGSVETSEVELLNQIKNTLFAQTETLTGDLGGELVSIRNILTGIKDLNQQTLATLERDIQLELGRDQAQRVDGLREKEEQAEMIMIFKGIKESLGGLDKSQEKADDQKLVGLGLLGLGGFFKGGFGMNVATGALGIGGGIAVMAMGLAKAAEMLDGLEFDGVKNALTKTSEGLRAFDFETIKKGAFIFGGAAAIGAGLTIAAGGGIKGALGGPLMILPALGLGISGFFSALALGDLALSKIATDGEHIKTAAQITVDVGKIFGDNKESLLGFATLMAPGAVVGAFFGVGRALAGSAGIAIFGAGLAAFFTSFAVADKAMDMLNDPEPLNNLPKVTKNLVDSIRPFSDNADSMKVMAGLLGAGGLFATVAGVKVAGKAAVGMGVIGLGIGSFFTGLAATGKIGDLLSIDGSGIGNIITNVGEGLATLDHDMFKTMLATGGIFGIASAIPGGLAVAGMAATGFGIAGGAIGAFFTGIAGIGDIAGAIGISGEGLKKILVNTGLGIKGLDGIDGPALIDSAKGIAALGPALALLYSGEGIGALFSGAGKLLDTVTFGLFTKDGKSIYEKTAENLAPIQGLGTEFANAVTGINNLSSGIKSLNFSDDEMDNISSSVDFLLGTSLKIGNAANVITEGGNFSDVNKALKKFGLDPDMPDYEFKGLVKIEGIDEAIESLQELSNHLMILPKQASVGFGPINTPTNTGNNSPTVIADNSVNTSSNRTISPTVNVSSPLITHFASGGPGS